MMYGVKVEHGKLIECIDDDGGRTNFQVYSGVILSDIFFCILVLQQI